MSARRKQRPEDVWCAIGQDLQGGSAWVHAMSEAWDWSVAGAGALQDGLEEGQVLKFQRTSQAQVERRPHSGLEEVAPPLH